MAGTQGQGAGTLRKERLFFVAAKIGMTIFVSKIAPRFKFWLFDGNCGSGYNEDVHVIGSPIAMHLAADSANLSVERRMFHFCDRDPDRLLALLRLIGDEYPKFANCSYLLPGDNEGALEQFGERIIASGDKPHYANGLVIVDPNGWFYRTAAGIGPPIDALMRFSRQFPRIDILLNLNYRIYKMQKKNGTPIMGPEAVLRSLNKTHWLVGQINPANSRFFVAVGRNFETGEYRKQGWYDWRSPEARQIFQEIEERRPDGALPLVSGLSEPPPIRRGANGGVSASQGALPLRQTGDRSASLATGAEHIPSVGDVRHPGQSEADLS